MTEAEVQQLILDIIERAQKADYTNFHLITSWKEFKYYMNSLKSTKIVLKVLKHSANMIFKTYCKSVAAQDSSVDQLLAYAQLSDIRTFYETDLKLIKRMLDEYDDYLGKGYFWYSFLGGEREL